MKRLVILLPILVLTCAGVTNVGQKKYVVSKSGAATASLKFLKQGLRISIMRGDEQYYGVMTGSTCDTAKKIASYGGGIGRSNKEKVVPVESGTKIRLLAMLQKQSDGGYQYENFYSCTNVIEFTPISGRNYTVIQEHENLKINFACKIQIVDEATGLAPDDIQELSAPSCHI